MAGAATGPLGAVGPPGAGPPLGWLVEVVRPVRAPVPWGQMLRALLAICGPLALGLATGHDVTGMLAATGGLLASVVDRGGPYAMRLRRILYASLFGGAAGLLTGIAIHGRGWVAVAVLTAVAGVSALVSTAGDSASLVGLQLLVYASFGTGPLGALRPWWHAPSLFIAGVAWAVALMIPGWLLYPRISEERRVAEVYSALAQSLSAAGTSAYATRRQAITAAMNDAYDELLTERAAVGGQDPRPALLIALLNEAHLLAEASATLAVEGHPPLPDLTAALHRLSVAIAGRGPAPAIPALPPGASAGTRALRDGLSGAADLITGRAPAGRPSPAVPWWRRTRDRSRAAWEQIWHGRTAWIFTARLTLCIGVAAVASEVLPLQRSYWVVLTTAIVLKPDLGSVFARALQRGIGTVVGAVAGALILAVVPSGPLLLIPMAVLAYLLPFGRSRNYGLLATFLTPLVVLLIDLLVPAGWRLAEARLLDTLLGCAIVLIVGYLPWPVSWRTDVPHEFAEATEVVSRYLNCALGSNPDGTAAGRSALRRQAYRALSDLRAEFQRAMSEPPAISRRATIWWPAVIALERTVDAVTAAAVTVSHGGPDGDGSQGVPLLPAQAAAGLAQALDGIAAAVRAGQRPPPATGLTELPEMRPVTEAVRRVQGAVSGVY